MIMAVNQSRHHGFTAQVDGLCTCGNLNCRRCADCLNAVPFYQNHSILNGRVTRSLNQPATFDRKGLRATENELIPRQPARQRKLIRSPRTFIMASLCFRDLSTPQLSPIRRSKSKSQQKLDLPCRGCLSMCPRGRGTKAGIGQYELRFVKCIEQLRAEINAVPFF